jgi:Domain of unknown function (DUF4252)
MSRFQLFLGRRAAALGAYAAVVLYVSVAAAQAQQTTPSAAGEMGRIEFDHASLSSKFVEIDLSPAMIGDLFGIGDGALAGAVDALQGSPQAKEGSKIVQVAAEKAEAAREFVSIAKSVVKSIRLRAYDDLQNQPQELPGVISRYDQQLQSGGWENLVRAQDGEKSVQVSAVRSDGAIKGLFVIASERNKLVLANVICDVSPENAKRLAATAVKTGLDSGLERQIGAAMMHGK